MLHGNSTEWWPVAQQFANALMPLVLVTHQEAVGSLRWPVRTEAVSTSFRQYQNTAQNQACKIEQDISPFHRLSYLPMLAHLNADCEDGKKKNRKAPLAQRMRHLQCQVGQESESDQVSWRM